MFWTELHKRISRNASKRSIQRQFVVILLFVGLVVTAFMYWKDRISLQSIIVMATVLVIFGALGFMVPLIIRPLLYVWLLIGMLLGELTSTVILGMVYYLLFFPITFILRKLKRKSSLNEPAWHSRKDDKIDYRKYY